MLISGNSLNYIKFNNIDKIYNLLTISKTIEIDSK